MAGAHAIRRFQVGYLCPLYGTTSVRPGTRSGHGPIGVHGLETYCPTSIWTETGLAVGRRAIPFGAPTLVPPGQPTRAAGPGEAPMLGASNSITAARRAVAGGPAKPIWSGGNSIPRDLAHTPCSATATPAPIAPCLEVLLSGPACCRSHPQRQRARKFRRTQAQRRLGTAPPLLHRRLQADLWQPCAPSRQTALPNLWISTVREPSLPGTAHQTRLLLAHFSGLVTNPPPPLWRELLSSHPSRPRGNSGPSARKSGRSLCSARPRS